MGIYSIGKEIFLNDSKIAFVECDSVKYDADLCGGRSNFDKILKESKR